MRSFGESLKSKKTVASMIEKRGGDDTKQQQPNKKTVKIVETKKEDVPVLTQRNDNSPPNEDKVMAERKKFIERMTQPKKIKVEK